MSYMDQILDQVGEEVTITHVESSSVDEWGYATDTTSEVTVTGKFEIVRQELSDEEEGDFNDGDLRGFLHSRWNDDISQGDTFTYNGRTYEINRLEVKRVQHGDKHLELRALPI